MATNDDRIGFAIAARLTSAALIATMSAMIKLAETWGAGLAELLFFRQAGATVLMAAIIAAGPGAAAIRTTRLPAHLVRAVVGLASMACMFGAITVLPLAEATTFQFTIPLFATILGAVVLKEVPGRWRWVAVGLGFVGILVVARPGSGHVPLFGAALGLTAASLSATVSILLRTLGRTEDARTTVFWFSALSIPPLAACYAFDLRAHPPGVWVLLAAIGVVGGLGQLTMTTSLRHAPVAVVLPMDYSALLWATLYGWALFGVWPGTATWAGAPLIIASGLVIVWRERVRHLRDTEQALT